MPRITYANEQAIDEPDSGLSLLEISLKHGIPHMHVCGGKARCSTCRVLVLDEPEHLAPRTEAEAALATRKGFDDSIRLACQARPNGDVTVRRLVIDQTDIKLVSAESSAATGREANLAVLFSDIRNFTDFSEANLPYDVVHILNRYFQPVGEAIIRNNGCIDKYIGDGMMALFGVDGGDPRAICLDAIRAALEMRAAMDGVNAYLENVAPTRFRIGIGVHFGTAVVGEIGHTARKQVTAIGDTVNFASRIESATKEFGTDLLVSDAVVRDVADAVRLGRSFDAAIRGKAGRYTLHEIVGLAEPAVP